MTLSEEMQREMLARLELHGLQDWPRWRDHPHVKCCYLKHGREVRLRYVWFGKVWRGREWLAARAVWLLNTGAWPTGRMRVRNGNPHDLRFANLEAEGEPYVGDLV